MAHTRYRIELMMGKKIHLTLKNGAEYYGVLDKAKFRKFGFSITYNVFNGKGISVGNCRDFVLSDIKKIELESTMKEVEE